jgi:hypothetical protein
MNTSIITAPWTPEQVDALNLYQKTGHMHPFTCGSGNRTDEKHLDGEGILFATVGGWVCPFCDYTQDWAHSFMLETGSVTLANAFDFMSSSRKRST